MQRFVFAVEVTRRERRKASSRSDHSHIDSIWLTFEEAEARLEQVNARDPYVRDYASYEDGSIRTVAFSPEKTQTSTGFNSGYGNDTPSRWENSFEVDENNWRTVTEEARHA